MKNINIIYEKQFGFRKGLSTADAVLEFVDHCVTNLDDKLYTIAIFLDLLKAFDTVNRDIMLDKLENIEIKGIANKWFASYLSDRRMNVQHLNSTSTTKNNEYRPSARGRKLSMALFNICQ